MGGRKEEAVEQLTYDKATHTWIGTTETLRLHIPRSVFNAAVRELLAAWQDHGKNPAPAAMQRENAVQVCRNIAYWDGRDTPGILREARLVYEENVQWWQGEERAVTGGVLMIALDKQTMEHYVTAYLIGQAITQPTPAQRQAALEHCRNFSFWLTHPTAKDDPNVRFRRFGREITGDGHAAAE
jgi:hypothetical protein